MQTKAFPRIGETLYTSTLPNGLTLHIVPKPGFRSFYAVFATNYGGAHRRFTLDGQTLDTPAGIAAGGDKLVVRTADEEAESRENLKLGHTVV